MCRDETRTKELLMVVARDADLDAMEKSSYRGYYFVLGGTIPLTVGPGEKIPGLAVLQKRAAAIAAEGGREVILAFPANPEGEHTAEMTAAALAPVAEKYQLTVTRLGRGLSTGTELEYADADTLASAFRNRQS
jgi:recombination protein RecR